MTTHSIVRATLAFVGFTAATAHGGLVATDSSYGTAHPDPLFDGYAPDVPSPGPTPIAIHIHSKDLIYAP